MRYFTTERFSFAKPVMQDQIKIFDLVLNSSLISNKARNRYSIICSEMNKFQLQT